MISDIIDFGFLSREDPEQEVCKVNRNTTKLSCDPLFNYGKMRTELEHDCVGKKNCTLHTLKNKLDHTHPKYGKCTAREAQFFIQFECHHTDSELASRRYDGALVGSIGVFTCLFFLVMVFYLRKKTKLDQIEWDVSTITAGDYTVEIKITDTMFTKFHNEFRQQNYALETIGYGFKKHIKSEIE